MRNKFVTGLASFLVLNIPIKLLSLIVIEIWVQNSVGEGEYGKYSSLLSFSIILNILLDLGIENFNKRNIAQNHQLISKHVSNVVTLKLLLALVYFVVSISVALIFGYSWVQMKLLFWLIFNQFLALFILYSRSNISGLQLFKTDSILSVLDRALLIVFCGVLLMGWVTDGPFKIEWFVYSQTAAYSIAAVIAFSIVISKCDFIKPRFDRTFFIVFLKQSYPYALLIFIMAVTYWFDQVLLERMLDNGNKQVGIYAQGFRFFLAAGNFGMLFGVLLLPMFAKMIKQKEPIGQLLQFSFLLMAIPGIILAIIGLFYGQEIMKLAYKDPTSESPVIFSILMVNFVFYSSGTYIFGALLTANGSLRQLNIMAIISVVINITVNVILIPIYGAVGCAIASFGTQFFAFCAQLFMVTKIFNFKVNYRLISLIGIYVAGALLLAYVCRELVSNWFVGLALLTCLCVIYAFAIRLLSIKSLIEIVRFRDKNSDQYVE